MAVAQQHLPSKLLTYEDYLAEGEINRRYDIIDGIRVFMTNPNIQHQEIEGNLLILFKQYQRSGRAIRTVQAPCDVLISQSPFRTRQPDLLLISHERFGGRDLTDPSPLAVAPELVVEVLSPCETRRVLADKIEDYCLIGVSECWVVSPEAQAVEVLRLANEGSSRVAIYGVGDTVQCAAWPDLTVPVADVFAE